MLRHNHISMLAELSSGCFLRDTRVGKYCYIGRNSTINSAEIGNYTCIAADVQIGGMEHSIGEHSISPAIMGDKCVLGGVKTVIGHDVWIAAGAIIKQGVKIGNGAVVGANSFVNKDVEPYAIVVGSPAKFMRYRKSKTIEDKLNESCYWLQKPKKAREIINNIQS